MTAIFYWYAWIAAIIVIFYIQKRTLRHALMLFIGIAMCTFSVSSLSTGAHIYIHVLLLSGFGTHLWVRRHRSIFEHFWPFVLSIGYAAILMFFVIHPVWGEFPGISLGMVLIFLLLRMIVKDIEGLLAIWMLMNAGGTLSSYVIFSTYSNEGLIESQTMMTFVLKGVLFLFVFYGVHNLKRAIRRKRLNSSSKGAAVV
ncbi:YphA family membrane protein [Halobacillus litoralis]|uniref:Uncharacterized protein n=1 Tax=Halobacillus litoralis TaxID=45668 RepID=A0A410M858_9BACI|nr:hypothetical protein [Halobacillus litoralis]QAS50766.1 hypothetical protein HLI_00405 [Halobacillus litoralis]